MKYQQLLTLNITHPYYTNNRCPDFTIEPTLSTEKLLKNHRCILKTTPTGIQILITVTEDNQTIKPFIPLPQGTKFTFHLRLQNPKFALFTDMTEITPLLAPFYTNANLNAANPVIMTLVSREAQFTEQFIITNPTTAQKFALAGRPATKLSLPDFTLTGLGTTTTPIAYDATSKVITVNTATAQQDTFTVSYPLQPYLTKGVFADVDIYYNDSLPDIAKGPGIFEIPFKAKKVRWQYYVIATESKKNNFSITDNDAPPLVFSSKNETDLNQNPDPTDDLAQTLAARYPDKQRLRFLSDEPIACQQQGRKSLQLSLDNVQILQGLPNPLLQNYKMIETTKDGTLHKEETLFQIIKYFT